MTAGRRRTGRRRRRRGPVADLLLYVRVTVWLTRWAWRVRRAGRTLS
jgi:hypothetical protein